MAGMAVLASLMDVLILGDLPGSPAGLNLGGGVMPVALAVVGLYLMLRGGGAWAMDIYVQKVQDRARRKAALNSPQSSSGQFR